MDRKRGTVRLEGSNEGDRYSSSLSDIATGEMARKGAAS